MFYTLMEVMNIEIRLLYQSENLLRSLFLRITLLTNYLQKKLAKM